MKIIKTKEQALESIHRGVNFAGDIVRSTYGPNGRNVLIGRKYGKPHDTNDGYTVIKAIELDDETENMAVRVLEGGAETTNCEAGDSTTTTVMLSQDIFNAGFEQLKDTGGIVKSTASPMEIKGDILEAKEIVLKELALMAQPVDTKETLYNVAFVSAQDKNLASIISDVVWSVGKTGTVKIEEADAFTIEHEIAQGMEVSSGYAEPWMATNDKKESVVDNPYILVLDEPLKSIEQIRDMVNWLTDQKIKDLVIFATDFDPAVLEAMKRDRIHDHFRALAIKMNVWDKGLAEDICSVTGATTDGSKLGKSTKIVANKIKTIIIGGVEDKSEAINFLNIDLDITKSLFEKEKIRERIARINGKVGIIRVGAATEIERGRVYDKVQDAVRASQGALQEGYVRGSGEALYVIGGKYTTILSEPLMNLQKAIGGDELSDDIIDSVKSLRVAIESGCATAISLLTAGATIVDKHETDTE